MTFFNKITFVSAFKKFKSPYDRIQHAAMYSWNQNNIQVIVPDNEIGVIDNCKKYPNIEIITDVKRARELGFSNQSPIVRDLLDKALRYISTPMVALINSDIIILPDFNAKMEKILKKYGYDIYMVGSRYGINLKGTINTEEDYKRILNGIRKGYDQSTSSDIFITSKFIWRKIVNDMPEFILGRYGWDNWLHMIAELKSLRKFNCTGSLVILHCEHDYRHISLQEKYPEKYAPSSQHNIRLWEKVKNVYGTTRISSWPKIIIEEGEFNENN